MDSKCIQGGSINTGGQNQQALLVYAPNDSAHWPLVNSGVETHSPYPPIFVRFPTGSVTAFRIYPHA